MTTHTQWRDTLQSLLDEARNGDVLESLGLRRASSTSTTLDLMGVLAAGVLIGAGLAALFTPRSGREMRQAIGQRAQELRSSLSGRTENLGERTGGIPH